MAAVMEDWEQDALTHTTHVTLADLQTRLARLEFHLTGESASAGIEAVGAKHSEGSVASRLGELQKGLAAVLKRAGAFKDLLGLYEKHPELFNATAPPAASSLPLEERLSVVLSAAPSYHATASQLSSILDTPIPPPQQSAKLGSLLPRIDKVEGRVHGIEVEVAELRKRSASLLERWYWVSVEEGNERVAEWDERLGECERVVKRALREKEREKENSGVFET